MRVRRVKSGADYGVSMKRILPGFITALVVVGLVQGCVGHRSTRRATNAEIRVLFQSCIEGDVLPCG